MCERSNATTLMAYSPSWVMETDASAIANLSLTLEERVITGAPLGVLERRMS